MTKKIKEIISKIADVKPHTIIHHKQGNSHIYEFVHNSSDEAKVNLIKIIKKEFPQFIVSKSERKDGFTIIELEEMIFTENPIFGGTMEKSKNFINYIKKIILSQFVRENHRIIKSDIIVKVDKKIGKKGFFVSLKNNARTESLGLHDSEVADILSDAITSSGITSRVWFYNGKMIIPFDGIKVQLNNLDLKDNPFGGSMDNKKLLMYAALAVGGWYAWQMWQKKKLGAGVQSALTQGSTTAQQMVSFI